MWYVKPVFSNVNVFSCNISCLFVVLHGLISLLGGWRQISSCLESKQTQKSIFQGGTFRNIIFIYKFNKHYLTQSHTWHTQNYLKTSINFQTSDHNHNYIAANVYANRHKITQMLALTFVTINVNTALLYGNLQKQHLFCDNKIDKLYEEFFKVKGLCTISTDLLYIFWINVIIQG